MVLQYDDRINAHRRNRAKSPRRYRAKCLYNYRAKSLYNCRANSQRKTRAKWSYNRLFGGDLRLHRVSPFVVGFRSDIKRIPKQR